MPVHSLKTFRPTVWKKQRRMSAEPANAPLILGGGTPWCIARRSMKGDVPRFFDDRAGQPIAP